MLLDVTHYLTPILGLLALLVVVPVGAFVVAAVRARRRSFAAGSPRIVVRQAPLHERSA